MCYLSRVPPFLKPDTLRRLLSGMGTEVLRIYLAPEAAAARAGRVRAWQRCCALRGLGRFVVILLSQQAKVSVAASVGVAGIAARSPTDRIALTESFRPMRCRMRELAVCKTLGSAKIPFWGSPPCF